MPEITAKLSTALADRYKIERHLGEGGMATVYFAHDLKHDRPEWGKWCQKFSPLLVSGRREVFTIVE